jgi:hypothetical protein
MLFLAMTNDRKYRLALDSTHPDKPACLLLLPRGEWEPVVLQQYDNSDDAELAGMFFLGCYHEALKEGFQLYSVNGEWSFQNHSGAMIPVSQALDHRTPEEFAELLKTL